MTVWRGAAPGPFPAGWARPILGPPAAPPGTKAACAKSSGIPAALPPAAFGLQQEVLLNFLLLLAFSHQLL